MKSKNIITRACVMAMLVTPAFLATGCGSDDSVANYSYNPNPNVQNAFVGRYLGTTQFTGGQFAKLDVNFDGSGQGAGTFSILAPGVTPAAIQALPTGDTAVTGRVDQATGVFTLTGNVAGVGALTVNGVLPRGNDRGFYIITLNGLTFSGVIQSASQGQPSAGGGTTSLITGGTVTNAVFTGGSNYNGQTSTLSNPLVGGVVVTGSSTSNLVTVTISSLGSPIRGLGLGVVTHGAALQVGQTYNLLSNPAADGAVISYQELNGNTVDKAWAQGANTTGQVTIDALTSTQATLTFHFEHIPVNPAASPNNATGEIDAISGQVTATITP